MPDPNNPDDNQIPQTFPEDTSIPPIPSGMAQDTSFPNPVQMITDAPPQEVNTPKKKFGGRKMIATILGLVVLIGGIAAGIVLVKQQQDIREKAGFEKSTPNPTPSCPKPNLPPGGLAGLCPGKGCKTITDIDSAGCVWGYTCDCPESPPTPIPTHSCSKPNLPPGGLAGLCPGEGCKTITDIDSAGCVSGYRCECRPEPTEPPTHTSTPISATPTPTPPAAMCSAVKAYDVNWNLLTSAQLSALTAGTTVRFTVSGSPADKIDKAKFIINGVERAETANKKPGTNEYYDEYTVPAGTTSFTVNAKLHHVTLGWF